MADTNQKKMATQNNADGEWTKVEKKPRSTRPPRFQKSPEQAKRDAENYKTVVEELKNWTPGETGANIKLNGVLFAVDAFPGGRGVIYCSFVSRGTKGATGHYHHHHRGGKSGRPSENTSSKKTPVSESADLHRRVRQLATHFVKFVYESGFDTPLAGAEFISDLNNKVLGRLPKKDGEKLTYSDVAEHSEPVDPYASEVAYTRYTGGYDYDDDPY